MKKLLFLCLFTTLMFFCKAQSDTVFLVDHSFVVGQVTDYNDTFVSVMSDSVKSKISSGQVLAVVINNGMRVVYAQGKIVSAFLVSGYYDSQLSISDKADEAGKSLFSAKNNFIAAGVFATVSLACFSYYAISRPDTEGLANDPLKLVSKTEAWENSRRNVAIVGAGSGVFALGAFFLGCFELRNAAGYLTIKKDLPVAINILPNRLAVAYRF